MKILNIILGTLMLLTSVISKKDQKDCVSWDAPFDKDNIQFCPDVSTPWSIMNCPWSQGKTFDDPTGADKRNMNSLIVSLKNKNSNDIIAYSSKLKLRVCRRILKNDSYLIFVTRPKVNDYSGPFIMFRETDSDPIFIQSPHDGSDGTSVITKEVFENTKSLFLISNGQSKGLSDKKAKCVRNRKTSDVAHSTNNLFWYAHKAITLNFPETVVIQVHGSAGNGLKCTNSLARKVEDTSAINVFALSVKNVFSGRPKDFMDKLEICNPGTVLNEAKKCALRST